MRLVFAVGAVVLFLFAGCTTTRSISNSGYRGNSMNWGYRGELSEFDIVGGPGRTNITEAEIQEALRSRESVRLRRGDPVLVIQSGAVTPDEELTSELERYFPSAPFSGQPAADKEPYAPRIRLAAAQGGYKYLICYWGMLEASHEDHATKTLSWVPIAGTFVPDESQKMRIRLKGIILDVASGRWKMVLPKPAEDERLSARFNRESSDQRQVALLKKAGYRELVAAIVGRD